MEGPWSRLLFGVLLFFCLAAVQAQHNAEAVGDRDVLLNPDQRHDASVERLRTETQRRAPLSILHPQLSSAVGVSGSVVFLNSLLMALANCLGAIPFFFVKHLSKETIGMANAIACGVMLACSFDLIHEGEPHGSLLVILGVLLGVFSAKFSQSYLQKYENVKFESLEGADARKILLVLGVMAAHAVGEGAGVGVSYSGNSGWSQGLLVTLAIGLHNIPEGLAVSTVLVARGVTPPRATLWSFISAVPQAMFALPAFLFVETFTRCLPVALGFAAGCMLWVVFSEFLPDAFDHISPSKAASTVTISAMWLEGARMGLNAMESYSGTFVWSKSGVLPHLTLLMLSVCICFVVRALISFKVPLTRFSTGISMGMQLVFSIALFCRQLFWGPLPLLSCSVWSSLGAALALINWHTRLPTLLQGIQKAGSENNGCLPQIHKLRPDSFQALVQFVRDPWASKLFLGLVGMGVVEGVKMSPSLSDPATSSVLALVALESVLLGFMTGFWLRQLQETPATANLLCGAIATLPGVTSILALLLGSTLTGLLTRITAVVCGFLLVNTMRLLFTKPSLKKTDSNPDQMSQLPETYVELEGDEKQDLLSSPPFYLYSGLMFGITIALAALLLMRVL